MRTTSVSLRLAGALVLGLAVASIAALSAHMVKGLQSPTGATAFVSSPSGGTDLLIPIKWGTAPAGDSGQQVGCFFVANTTLPRTDRPDFPRVIGAGFELPGSPGGFTLLEPLDGNWELVEGVQSKLNGTKVTLDFAIVTTMNGKGRKRHPHELRGIPPGQLAIRGSGTRFCVSGPFPLDAVTGLPTPVEQVINGVVVGFHGVDGVPGGQELGIWDNAARVIPLYP